MPTSTLNRQILSAAILGFEEQKRKLDAQIAEIRAMLSDAPVESAATPEPATGKRRTMSAAGRRAIAEAQRKRWAASKRKPEAATSKTPKPKRKLSAAGRAAIVAALKKRWAAKKAASKT